jgi:hypothetical protein
MVSEDISRKHNVKTAFMSDCHPGIATWADLEAEIAYFELEARRYSIPRDFSLRCSAERSMPMNSAVRDMFPPNRLI